MVAVGGGATLFLAVADPDSGCNAVSWMGLQCRQREAS